MHQPTCTPVTTAPAPMTLPRAYTAPIAIRPRSTNWPFDPDDVTALQWWRTMPADRLKDAQHLLMRSTLETVSLIKRQEWLGGLRGDAAAGIAIALHCLPVTAVTIKIDLAMSTVALHALEDDAASALVLSHVLRRVALEHPFARDLAASWLALNPRRAIQGRTDGDGSDTSHARLARSWRSSLYGRAAHETADLLRSSHRRGPDQADHDRRRRRRRHRRRRHLRGGGARVRAPAADRAARPSRS